MTRRTTIVAVVAVLVIGTSAVVAFDADSYATADAPANQETTTATEATGTTTTAGPSEATTTVAGTTTATPDANVTFANQTSNGTAVVVERVVVPDGGFVAVFRSAEAVEEAAAGTRTETQSETLVPGGEATQEYVADELAGNSTYLEPGVHRNVTVQLNRTLEESQVLVAMPYEDTNDNRQFDFPQGDEPYLAFAPINDWANVTLETEEGQTTGGTETTTEGA